MSDEITAEVIATTQSLLSKHIKKPPLTEKLLRKPPFRFIHDVISTIIKETGFLKGLYSKEDLNPENIKDKEGKVVFLKKLIYAINYSTDVQIVVQPQKIVAGLDVMKTNELLQALAKALDKKIDSTDAVRHALEMVEKESTQPNTSKKLHNNLKKENIKSNPKKSVQAITERNNKDNEGSHPATEKKIKVSERRGTKGKKLNQSPPKKNRISKEPTSSNHTLTNPESTHHDVKNNVTGSTEPSDTSDTQTLIKQSLVAKINYINQEEKSNHGYLKDDKTTNSNSEEQEFKKNVQGDNSSNRTLSNKAVEKQLINQDNSQGDQKHSDSTEYFVDRREDIINEPVEKNQIFSSLSDVVSAEAGKGQRTSIRPASARPGAPRIHDKGLALPSHNDHKMASDVVNLITDVNAMIKNDEESLVTVETVMTHMDIEKGHDQSHVARSEDQGHLVSQIIETKNELEDTGQDKMDIISDVNSSWTIQKENIISREVEHLQSALQKLTRGVNPLGKLIDFLQQDFESMQKELENWTITYQDSTKKLRNEEKVTKERMKPLIKQLEDISHLIQDQLEESTMVKAMIINNDETLDKHLKSHSLHHT